MKIIKGDEPISVEHPVFCWFGQPGIGKSSLGYSTKDPLALDFDAGAHRAANRRDTLAIASWADVVELMEDKAALEPYATVVVDTVGRCLDVMTADIIEKTPKLGPNGNLSQQGWGILKTRFRTWISQLRTLGKDVALIAHDKEDKDGDTRVVRPDIVGGSYGEVMKVSDFVAYMYMSGKDRILDFNPTDRWVGKNPAGWKPFAVPPIGKAQTFMADLFDQGRKALGTISETSAKVTREIDDWRARIEEITTAAEANQALKDLGSLSAIVQPQVKALLWARSQTITLTFDKAKRKFTDPAPKQPEPEAEAVPL